MEKENGLFVGRDEEQKMLDAVLRSKTAEFIAVYGRRRVGKTYLIKDVFKQKDCIFFHITGTQDATMSEQIDDFTRVIETIFYHNEFEFKNPGNWKKVFELLTKAIEREVKQQKVVLFFDELPWLASKRSRFIQALDYYWNRFWSDMPKIKLIVCGSAASWMLTHVISHKGGLHNRISGQIALYPFDLKETKEFLISNKIKYNDNQVLDVFMIVGGIPYYLKFLKKNLSVAQNIDHLCFQNKGQLIEEFSRLYSSLFSNAETYEELVRIIASKRRGIERTEIFKKSKYSTDGGRLKKRLDALEKSGFIVSFKPYGFTKRGTFYRIIDEYSLFYLNWIEPAISNIRKLDK
ncbi:MAG: AAA family ATPase, partial [Proteobacteria bacterium]|nr:AAA family ATPase [Pseudomonadota bacterium]